MFEVSRKMFTSEDLTIVKDVQFTSEFVYTSARHYPYIKFFCFFFSPHKMTYYSRSIRALKTVCV